MRVHIKPCNAVEFDRGGAIQAYRQMMECLGIPAVGDMEETPRRVVDSLIELGFDEPWNLTTFDLPEAGVGQQGDVGMVIVKDIPLKSLCAHHMLPFYGSATVAYIPDKRMVGLSKLARMVQSFMAGPQTQEIIGMNVADFLMKNVQPRGCMVVLKATHTCMSIRGACASGATTTTSTLRGVFYSDMRTREEAMQLLRV